MKTYLYAFTLLFANLFNHAKSNAREKPNIYNR